MRERRRAWLVLCAFGALGALALGACQRAPAPTPQATPSLTLAARAAQALEKGDYAGAADLARQALVETPDGLSPHYTLAVASSHLNLKQDAIREFRWVLRHAPKGSVEAEAARRWLAAAGALETATGADEASADEAKTGGGRASIEGQMVLPEDAQNPPQRRMVILYGLPDTPTREERLQVRTDERGRFKFANVTPGTYMITDAVAGARNWRLRVQVTAGQALTLDLTPANHVRVKDDFPTQG
jgi:hypothetical protein